MLQFAVRRNGCFPRPSSSPSMSMVRQSNGLCCSGPDGMARQPGHHRCCRRRCLRLQHTCNALCACHQVTSCSSITSNCTAGLQRLAASLAGAAPRFSPTSFDRQLHFFDEGRPELVAQYLLVLDALNFCFWPQVGAAAGIAVWLCILRNAGRTRTACCGLQLAAWTKGAAVFA